MAEAVHIEAVERVLASLSQKGETLLSSFLSEGRTHPSGIGA